MSQLANERVRLGGFIRRGRPGGGGRPVVRFVIALVLTAVYTWGCIELSDPWRSELEEAIGPIMAWLIPTLLAYIPAVVIGFLFFTLILIPLSAAALARTRRARGRGRVAAGHRRSSRR